MAYMHLLVYGQLMLGSSSWPQAIYLRHNTMSFWTHKRDRETEHNEDIYYSNVSLDSTYTNHTKLILIKTGVITHPRSPLQEKHGEKGQKEQLHSLMVNAWTGFPNPTISIHLNHNNNYKATRPHQWNYREKEKEKRKITCKLSRSCLKQSVETANTG